MYPRVKVRQQKEEDDQYGYESLPSLKVFESLSLSDVSSSDDSPTSVVRIPRACILSPDRHGRPSSTGRTSYNNQNISGGSKKNNARATSVPRPRAVLSSPDNDQMIRMRSKTKAEILSGLKNHKSYHNRHTKCKTFPKSIQAENPTNGNKGSKEMADGNHNSYQNRHTKCKTFPKSIQAENPTNGNKGSKEMADGKLDPRARARLLKANPSKKPHLPKGDQDSVCSEK